jgi:hypothetical protein
MSCTTRTRDTSSTGRDCHVQGGEIVLNRLRLALGDDPLGVRSIKLRPFTVFLRKADALEIAGGPQDPAEQRRIIGQFGNRDLRQRPAHLLAFGRIVVEEDEAVETEFEGLRDRAQVRRLVVPVRDESGNVAS